ncbi:MAG: hypothetical protein RLZZ200_3050 [Pseudomonadota bacterium]|jgi:hypothetical protein
MLSQKNMKLLHTSLACTLLLAYAAPAYVHHSGAMFDTSREVSIAGVVKEFNWTNPHSSFKVEVTDATGKSEIWAVEMNGPQNLMHEGWKRSSLKQGDRITAVVHPLRDGKPGGSYVSVTLADGTVLRGTGPGQNYGNTPGR